MVLTKIPGSSIVDGTITSTDILDSTITNAKMAVDPANASLLTSGDVPLAQLGNVPDPDLTAQKGDIVFTYSDGAGTAVINTNITAEISAGDGSTWTAFTLASQGTTGGHTILTSLDQTITSTITSPWNMRYRIKTLVLSVSMQTRIQAVSLGWS